MSPLFFKRFMRVMLVLIALFLLAALVCFLILKGWQQLFFSVCFIILALNAGLAYLFARVNTKKAEEKKPR